MRKQQNIWDIEHKKEAALPSLAFNKPYSGVIHFCDFLQTHTINAHAKIADIGCGKGRNTIFLAKQGYSVFGIDYIASAVLHTQLLTRKFKLEDKIIVTCSDLDKTWPYKDNFFDHAVDCFSSIDIETKQGRIKYKQELFRTLKPKGYAFIAVVSAQDEIEKEFIKNYPGSEKNSTIWPDNGKFQKDYDEQELSEFYNEFNIVQLETITRKTFKLGRYYTATNIWLIIQKP